MTRTQRIISFLLVIFLLYAVISAPDTSAYYVRQIFNFLSNAVAAIFRFFDSVIG
jgi:hypothetical protein